MTKPVLVDEYTCGICDVRFRVFTDSPDKYVRKKYCECCESMILTEKSETWKDKLYKAFLKKRRF